MEGRRRRSAAAQVARPPRPNSQLKVDDYNRLESQLKGEVESAQQQVRKLETERVALVDRNAGSKPSSISSRPNGATPLAAVAATQENNQRLADEVTGLRHDIRTNEQARDQAFATTLTATEDLHQTKGQLDNTVERNRQLTKQVSGMTRVMDAKGIDPNTPPDAVVPTVDGIVSQVRQAAGAQLVEVTIGADDGLKQGQHGRSLSRRPVPGPHRNPARRRPIERWAASIAASNKDRFRRVTVSQPDSESTRPAGILVRRPTTNDLHRRCLGVAVAALMLGSLFLFLRALQLRLDSGTPPWSAKAVRPSNRHVPSP